MAEPPTGFFEESPGVYSATRLVLIVLISVCALIGVACAFAIVYVAVHPESRDGMAGVFGTVAGIIGALGAAAWAQRREITQTAISVNGAEGTST
jgi:hypothetical protein